MTKLEAAGVLANALMLARDRVTGETLEAKQKKRDLLKDAVSRVYLWQDGDGPAPPAAELRELLGDPGDARIREALETLA